ncbi:MAG TPA: sulfite exporter TauE/SafE family protein, partial [Vicinamibacterales bacterium]|nr:sulfite exporter TauE/SafE family protein [Vicinamibacterales bacterium]
TLTGTGGGVLVSPALNSWCGVPMRVAAATSAVIIGVTAIPGVVDNVAKGHLTQPVLAASAVLGVLAGSRAGFWIGEKVSVRSLKILMAVVLSIVAAEYLVFR